MIDDGSAVVDLGPRSAFVRAVCRTLEERRLAVFTRVRRGINGVEQSGVSDLVLSEKKIGGSCVHRTRGYLYYSTTLLVEQNMLLVERYLQHPPREPEYRQGRPHGEFMGSLRALCGLSLADDFVGEINDKLNNNLRDLSRNVNTLDAQ